MQRDADTAISNNEKTFITEALAVDCRLDGRSLYDYRRIKFEFALDDSSVTLTLGTTRVTAVITATLEAPYPDRQNEGSIRFNVECGPMASPAFDAGRPGPLAVQLARLVERTLKQSGALDAEALCVIAGRKVWALRCDVHVLDHGGNLVDACVLAALAAFMVFRKPDVTVGGESGTDVIIHSREVREPLPLTIHHTPVAVTWALYQASDGSVLCAVDPSLREEAAQAGSATFMVNTGQEVCGTHKADGLGLTAAETMRLVRLSFSHAESLVAALRQALQAHDVARVAARVRRTKGIASTAAPSRHVSISSHPAGGVGAQQQQEQLEVEGIDGMDLSGGSDDESESDESENGSESEDEEMEEVAVKEEIKPGLKPTGGNASARPRSSGPLLPSPGKAVSGTQRPAAGSPAPMTAQPSSPVIKPSPAKRAAQAPKLEDNLETIAALIAGKTPGASGADDDDLDLKSAIKHENVKKKKSKKA